MAPAAEVPVITVHSGFDFLGYTWTYYREPCTPEVGGDADYVLTIGPALYEEVSSVTKHSGGHATGGPARVDQPDAAHGACAVGGIRPQWTNAVRSQSFGAEDDSPSAGHGEAWLTTHMGQSWSSVTIALTCSQSPATDLAAMEMPRSSWRFVLVVQLSQRCRATVIDILIVNNG